MKLIHTIGQKKHRFWHGTKLVKDTRFTQYYECKRCETRIVIQPEGGYQPIDWDWVYFKGVELEEHYSWWTRLLIRIFTL